LGSIFIHSGWAAIRFNASASITIWEVLSLKNEFKKSLVLLLVPRPSPIEIVLYFNP
jgi:hypothetical protein